MTTRKCPFVDEECLALGRTDVCCHWIQRVADAEPCLVNGPFISENWHSLGIDRDSTLKKHVDAARKPCAPWKDLDDKQQEIIESKRPTKLFPDRVSCEAKLIGHKEVMTDVKNLFSKCDSVFSRDMHHNVKRVFKSPEFARINNDLRRGLTICLVRSFNGKPMVEHHYQPVSKVMVLKNVICYPDLTLVDLPTSSRPQ
jgi:hypothetical protein